MLKRKFSKLGELGSLMVEALAMLGLISMVTPIIYKKAAERQTELQDVNTASQMRNLSKAFDQYISDNYGKITSGTKVTNDCPVPTVNYASAFTNHTTGEYAEIDMRHLCDYLPYGFLDENGKVVETKLFDDNYHAVVKMVDTDASAGGNAVSRKVLTGFIVASPKVEDFPRLRASRISSMIGGNGGYIEEDPNTNKLVAHGVQGLWSVRNVAEELGVDDVENGTIIATSVNPITSGSGINDESVLYRVPMPGDDHKLNTMETTLWMGSPSDTGGATAQNIENINQAVIVASRESKMDGATADRALWIKNYGGAFVSGVLGVAEDSETGEALFQIDDIGGVSAVGGDFKVTEGGAVEAVGGAFQVTKSNTTTASDGTETTTGVDGGVSAVGGKFTIGSGGSMTAADKKFEIDSDGKTRIGDAISNKPIPANTEGWMLTVNGNAFINGLLQVLQFRANEMETGILRAGLDPDKFDTAKDDDYTLYVNRNSLNVGVLTPTNTTMAGDVATSGITSRFQVDRTTGNTTFRGGNVSVLNDDTKPILEINNSDGDIKSYLTKNDSKIYGQDVSGNEMYIFDNSLSMIKHTESSDYSAFSAYNSSSGQIARIEAISSGDESAINVLTDFIELYSRDLGENGGRSNIYLDAKEISMGLEDVDRVRLHTDTDSRYLVDMQNIDGFRVAGSNATSTDDLVLQVDVDEKWAVSSRANKGSVYVRKGVVELEGGVRTDMSYVEPANTDSAFAGFKTGGDTGYIRADMLIAQGVGKGLTGNVPDKLLDGHKQYESYMVNPAYTSVMHDIKLTTRGGARLSDILPDFINKGIYITDNTYKETLGDWRKDPGLKVVSGVLTADNFETNSNKCDSYSCATSPWQGLVPLPQCPPGYLKAIQIVPVGFNIAQAGDPGKKRKDFRLYTDPRIQSAWNSHSVVEEDRAEPLFFQKNTWLRLRTLLHQYDGSNAAWSVIMGYIYPATNEMYGNVFSDSGNTWFETGERDNIVKDDNNNFIWNLFPVYYKELEAAATVFCYFPRGKEKSYIDETWGVPWDPNFVDTSYDQLENFRNTKDKGGATNIERLDDPNMIYKNPW